MATVSTPVPPALAAPSRRALLAGVLGGIGAWAASTVTRRPTVRAADGENIQTGGEYATETVTKLTNSANSNEVLRGESLTGTGVRGFSTSGIGVQGSSSSNLGVRGGSSSSVGVYGITTAASYAAILGSSFGNSTGVQGYSAPPSSEPPPKPKTGVYGYANQDSTANGVWGDSPAGRALIGSSTTGWAGYFKGRVFVERYQELKEISNPSAPGANKARVFIRDNGAGKTQLCVRFESGAIQVLATQP